MAVRIRQVTRTTQPQEFAKPSDIWQGVVGLWVPVSGQLVNCASDVNFSLTSVTSSTVQDGAAAKFLSSSNSEGNLTNFPHISQFTAIVRCRIGTGREFSNYSSIVGHETTYGDLGDWYLYRKGADGTLAVDIPWGANSVVTGPVLTENVWYTIGLTRTGSSGSWTYSLFVDGQAVGSATTATNPSTGNLSLVLGHVVALNHTDIEYSVFGIGPALSAETTRQLTSNPWQLFEPEQIVVKAGAAGGGPTYTLTAATGTFTLTGQSANLKVSRKLTAATGTFSLTGISANLVYTPVSGATYTLTAQTGVFNPTGQAAAFKVSRKLTAGTGVFYFVGNAANFYPGGVIPTTTKGGAGKGKNLTLKQKKKLKQVVNQEWLKAEQTVQELLLDRLGHAEPAKVKIEKLTASKSLVDVIEALKALSKETVTLPEQQAVIKTINKTIVDKTTKPAEKVSDIEERMAKFEKRLVDIEEMVLVVMSEIM